jgi:hypothetical protein
MEVKLYDYSIDDYEFATELNLMPEQLVINECLTWMKKDGSGIIVKDMSDDYIKNCINIILNNEWRFEWLNYFNKVLNNRVISSRKRKFGIKKF